MDMELFHKFRENGLVKNNLHTAKVKHLGAPPIQKPYPPEAQLIPLPEPDFLEDHQVSFLELMELRSTVREYSPDPLNMKELKVGFMYINTKDIQLLV